MHRSIVKLGRIIAFVAALSLATTNSLAGKTFDAVKQRGIVHCGVNNGLPGFSAPDSKGKWRGMDIDICQAVAAAVFGNKDKFKVVALSAQQRFDCSTVR